MATKITITLEETLDEEQIRMLKQYLLSDALYEYYTRRQGDYVNRVYSHMHDAAFERKLSESKWKVEIARRLHQNVMLAKVETFVGPCKACGAPGMADAVFDPPDGDDPRRCGECGML